MCRQGCRHPIRKRLRLIVGVHGGLWVDQRSMGDQTSHDTLKMMGFAYILIFRLSFMKFH